MWQLPCCCSMAIEGWLDQLEVVYYRKNYRTIRTCSPWLLGSPTTTFMGGTCYKVGFHSFLGCLN
jgi:hypothetical protein